MRKHRQHVDNIDSALCPYDLLLPPAARGMKPSRSAKRAGFRNGQATCWHRREPSVL